MSSPRHPRSPKSARTADGFRAAEAARAGEPQIHPGSGLDRFSPGGRAHLARVPWPVNLLGAVLLLTELFFAAAFLATLFTPG